MMRRSTSFLSKTRGAGPSSDIALPPKYLYINIQYSPQKIQFILNLWKPVDHFSTFFLKCFFFICESLGRTFFVVVRIKCFLLLYSFW